MNRFAFTVAYDGTRYHGFQVQRTGQTIQGELESALQRVAGESIRVVGAGRTDAGTHAVGQVAACTTSKAWTPADLQRALNALLPPDVAVIEMVGVPEGFHPRFDAYSRAYRYRIWNAAVRSPTERLYSLHVAQPLHLTAMNAACEALVGEHDFATFGSPVGRSPSTTRRVYRAEWGREGHVVWFDVEANAFLRRMVRGLVGTLLLVGQGRLAPTEVAERLADRARDRTGPSAPAHGLWLTRVTYPSTVWGDGPGLSGVWQPDTIVHRTLCVSDSSFD